MATTVKSTSVTNLDATPATRNTDGEGGIGRLKSINDFVTTTANVVQNIKLVRVPTTAKIKAVFLESAAQTQGSFDVGVYYSSATNDGTAAANQGVVIDANFFGSSIDCASAVAKTDVTNEALTPYTVDKRNMPLWQALSLSFDPGGFFDIALSSVNTVTTGGLVSLEVQFV